MQADLSLIPSPCVCNKISTLYRLVNKTYATEFRSFKLTNEQVSILLILMKKGPFRQQDLAELMALDKSTLSRNISGMLDKKWIKQGAADDKRVTVLSLTKVGLKKAQEIAPTWMGLQNKMNALLGKLTITEIDKMIIAFKKM